MSIDARLKSIHASDIMTKFAVTATEDQNIIDLANLFVRFNISGVPVLDEEHKIVGIATTSNLFDHMKGIVDVVDSSGDDCYDCKASVGDIMTKEVCTVNMETSLHEMITLMYDQHIHTFPVVRDGQLVGVIGRRDVVNACYATVCCSQT